MAGVYGEFLAYFSELMESFKVYKQTPLVTSGYKLEYSHTVRGVRQNDSDGIIDKSKRVNLVMDVGSCYTLWTYEKIDPATDFVEIDGDMYRPMSSSAFNREGGFYVIKVEMLVGNDGRKNDNAEISGGEFGWI